MERPLTRRTLLAAAAGAAALGVVGAMAAQGPAGADLIFTSGKVITLDSRSRVASALAVAGERIIAVGTDAEVLAHKGRSTRIVDLAGRTIVPGLQDSHIHFRGLGRDMTQRADFTYARSAADILEAVRALKLRLKPAPGAWLLGSRWDQSKYPDMATRWQLDAITPENPVRLGRVYRGVLVNTAALRLMGIDDERSSTWPAWWLEDPAGFTFEDRILRARRRVTVDGQPRDLEIPTGVFLGRKGAALVTVRPSADGFASDVDSVKAGVQEMLRLGVTSIVDADSRGDYDMRVYQASQAKGELRLRVPGVYFGSVYKQPPQKLVELLRPINRREPDTPFLRWRGIKFYSDGGAGTRSAWVSEPFARWKEIEGVENRGEPEVASDAERERQYRAVTDLGWDLHTHSCGDVAMRQTVSLYAKLLDEIRARRPGADVRWSVIHAYLPTEPATAVLAEMARHRIIAVPSPVFNWQQGKSFAENLGSDRMARTQPFRSYFKAGVLMPSGSDYPVTSHDPWVGIYALLTRRDQATGQVFGPQETVGIMDALRSYTTHGAYLTYDDTTRGSLEVGKLADLVLLDLADIHELERHPELCFRMRDRILLTLVGGQVEHQRGTLLSNAARPRAP
ncbi:MAG: amidohydrolase [Vicinamibacterales bacterium]